MSALINPVRGSAALQFSFSVNKITSEKTSTMSISACLDFCGWAQD